MRERKNVESMCTVIWESIRGDHEGCTKFLWSGIRLENASAGITQGRGWSNKRRRCLISNGTEATKWIRKCAFPTIHSTLPAQTKVCVCVFTFSSAYPLQ